MTGLEDLYREIILDHYRSPRNRGELPCPPAHRVEGFNPLCGDEVVVYLQVDGDVLDDVRIGGQGCSISQSSASLMASAIKGKPVAEVRKLIRTFKSMMSIHGASLPHGTQGDVDQAIEDDAGDYQDDLDESLGDAAVDLESLGELAALQGVVKFPSRIKCATLPWNTLVQALDEAEKEAGSLS